MASITFKDKIHQQLDYIETQDYFLQALVNICNERICQSYTTTSVLDIMRWYATPERHEYWSAHSARLVSCTHNLGKFDAVNVRTIIAQRYSQTYPELFI